jgi:hypothetical protein
LRFVHARGCGAWRHVFMKQDAEGGERGREGGMEGG